jgi:hypothetical protein
MGVFSGNLSFTRYFVEGEFPTNKQREYILERVSMYITPSLAIESEEESVIGWTSIENILHTQFNTENLFFNEYTLFALRIDSWKIPPNLLKAHQQQAEREFLAEFEREKLTKRERDQVHSQIRNKLKSMSLPHIATYDVCLHIQDRGLRFWSLSNRINDIFLELFEKTFPSIQLIPQTPYTLTERIGYESNQLDALCVLELEPFVETLV